jgi:hypothetical protein
MSGNYVAPTGYIDLDNDCEYSIDLKSTRSRETVDPKEDLAFYFDTYLVPKYGLNNINVNNCASFLKELDMNWTKLSPQLQSQVMDILVDGILNKDTKFKEALLAKLNVQIVEPVIPSPSVVGGGPSVNFSKSSFGSTTTNTLLTIGGGVLLLAVVFLVLSKIKKNPLPTPKFI